LRAYYEDAGVWGLRSWMGSYELGLSLPPEWVGEWVFSVGDEDPEGVIEAGMVTNFESRVLYSMIDTLVYEDTGARVLSNTARELIAVA
jgi:Xaa-Pro dipeptidase